VGIGIDAGPDLGDFSGGCNEKSIAGSELVIATSGKGHAVGVDDFVVGVGEQFEGERIFGAEGFVAFDGVERDTEYDSVECVVLGQVALEVMGLNGAAAGHVFGIKVEDNPFSLVLRERYRSVFLRGQAEAGSGSAWLEDIGCVHINTDTARGHDAEDDSDANTFANHRNSPCGVKWGGCE